MPTIVRKPSTPKRKKNYNTDTVSNKVHKLYNTRRWAKLRDLKMMESPLCEMCLLEGVTKEVDEVHHRIPISYGKTEWEMREIAYDYTNLVSLCERHHHEIHNRMRRERREWENKAI